MFLNEKKNKKVVEGKVKETIRHEIVPKMSLTRKIMLVVFLILVLIGLTFFLTKKYYSNRVKTVEITKHVEKVVQKEVEISGKTIKEGMEKIGKLSTAEYTYTHVERFDSSKKIKGFTIPFTKASFIYSYDGFITAGIDFAKIEIHKDTMKKSIEVILPDVEIHSSAIDEKSFKLYDQSNNIFNPISVSDVADSLMHLKQEEEAKAIEKGLLETAKKNAILLLENFMHGSYNIENYEIRVRFEKEMK